MAFHGKSAKLAENAGIDCPEICVFDGVYAPREDSVLLASAVRSFAKGRFLDLGCGTGIQGLVASRNKDVTQVVFSDANPAAVANAQFNASVGKISKPNVFLQSDLFSALGAEEFDAIAFNPPYLPTGGNEKVSGPLNRAFDGGKSGRKVTDRFLRQFPSRLNHNGVMLLVDSSLAHFEKSIQFLESMDFCVQIACSQRFFFEEVVVLKATRSFK